MIHHLKNKTSKKAMKLQELTPKAGVNVKQMSKTVKKQQQYTQITIFLFFFFSLSCFPLYRYAARQITEPYRTAKTRYISVYRYINTALVLTGLEKCLKTIYVLKIEFRVNMFSVKRMSGVFGTCDKLYSYNLNAAWTKNFLQITFQTEMLQFLIRIVVLLLVFKLNIYLPELNLVKRLIWASLCENV